MSFETSTMRPVNWQELLTTNDTAEDISFMDARISGMVSDYIMGLEEEGDLHKQNAFRQLNLDKKIDYMCWMWAQQESTVDLAVELRSLEMARWLEAKALQPAGQHTEADGHTYQGETAVNEHASHPSQPEELTGDTESDRHITAGWLDPFFGKVEQQLDAHLWVLASRYNSDTHEPVSFPEYADRNLDSNERIVLVRIEDKQIEKSSLRDQYGRLTAIIYSVVPVPVENL